MTITKQTPLSQATINLCRPAPRAVIEALPICLLLPLLRRHHSPQALSFWSAGRSATSRISVALGILAINRCVVKRPPRDGVFPVMSAYPTPARPLTVSRPSRSIHATLPRPITDVNTPPCHQKDLDPHFPCNFRRDPGASTLLNHAASPGTTTQRVITAIIIIP